MVSWGSLFAQAEIEILHTDENIKFDEIAQRSHFSPQRNYNKGLKNGVYWLKINQLPENQKNLLRIKAHHITEARAVDIDGKPFYSLPNTLFPTFSIPSKRMELPVFIRLKFDQEAYFPVDFLSRAELEHNQQSTLFSFGLFYGALFFIVIANLILFIMSGEKNFWTYAALLLSVGIALGIRDNLIYLFGWQGQWQLNIELLSHILIGVFGGFFAYSFIDLKYKSQKIGKFFIFGFGGLACFSMLMYWILQDFIYFVLADTLIFICMVALWAVFFYSIKKTKNRYIVFAVYAVNIYFILEFFVLHNFGVSLLHITPLVIKMGIVADMIILSIAIFREWQKLKDKSSAIMADLKYKAMEIERLSQYKRQDDLHDDYLENLIENHDLTNREVKILQMLSIGQTKSKMAETLQISRIGLDEAIVDLYSKLGISDDTDNIFT